MLSNQTRRSVGAGAASLVQRLLSRVGSAANPAQGRELCAPPFPPSRGQADRPACTSREQPTGPCNAPLLRFARQLCSLAAEGDSAGAAREGSREAAGAIATRQMVVTASGPDQPGIVSRLSKRVLESGGNVEESRMARLAGQFSIIMLITVDATAPRKAEELSSRLLEIEGLQVNTHWTTDERLHEKAPKRKFRRISLRGADNPGLVYNVTEYLSSNGINIENLDTSTQEAPFGGATLFTMDGIITMPITMSTTRLMSHLDILQSTLGVDIKLLNLDPSRKADDVQEYEARQASHGGAQYEPSWPTPQTDKWSVNDIAL